MDFEDVRFWVRNRHPQDSACVRFTPQSGPCSIALRSLTSCQKQASFFLYSTTWLVHSDHGSMRNLK